MSLNVTNATSSTGTGTTLTIQFPNNITAGSTLVIALAFPDGQVSTIVSLADNNSHKWKNAGSAWDFIGQGKYAEFWVAENSVATPNAKPTVTLTVTVSAALLLACCEVTGAATQYSLDQATYSLITSGGANVPFSSAATPTTYQADEAVIGFALAGGTLSAGSGFTSQASGVYGGLTFCLESKIVSATGQYSSTFTNSQATETTIACVMTIRAPGAITSFYHVQGNMTKDQSGGGLTVKLTFALDPTPGNLVCLGMLWYGGGSPASTTITSIIDDNGNHYTVAPSSVPSGGGTFSAYLLKAPANASKGITVTWHDGVADADIWGDEFTYPGTCTFDTDNKQIAQTGSGNNLNGVSITPAKPGELLWCQMTYNNGPITAPHNGSLLNGWTGGPEFIFTGESTGLFPQGGASWSEYYLSAPAGTTNISFTDGTSGDGYEAAVMAFYFTPPASTGISGGTNVLIGSMQRRPYSEFIA